MVLSFVCYVSGTGTLVDYILDKYNSKSTQKQYNMVYRAIPVSLSQVIQNTLVY